DKPDLRNPILLADVTESFRGSGFGIFAKAVDKGSVVRAVPAPGAGSRVRSFFDNFNNWAQRQGKAGLGYIIFAEDGTPKG
ncbi:GAD domain-containing protein, partial [Tritonibacter sp. SIMBA_163]|uniref:GAD domain-containing protein n=1 Tax=Tritonibacter sp. SIMBA_163 TaxID=3080868 RepID=UPI003980BAAB